MDGTVGYYKSVNQMTKRELFTYIISFTMLLIAVFSVINFPGPFTNVMTYLQNTFFWWLIEALILVAFFLNSYYFLEKGNVQNLKVVQLYLLWNIICIFRGTLIAENYWDWKGLIGASFGMLIPIVTYSVTSKMVLQSMLSFYVKYALPLFVIIAFAITTDAYGFYLIPISFFMMFFPLLVVRWKIVIFAITMLVIIIDLGARSNVLKFGLPILLMSIYYFRTMITLKLFEFVRILLLITPILLFLMAISGVFNVFNMDQYIKGNYKVVERDSKGQLEESNLTTDTRTFLYVDVLQTAKIYDCWWFGRSPARGNISDSFGDEDKSGRGERLGNEAGILNVFMWTGMVGVICLLLVFYKASYLSIHQSNNIFSKIIGIYVAFRWLYIWVEDSGDFNLSTIFLWSMIGVCFSKSFRNMTNTEVKVWIRGILDNRYKKYFLKLSSSTDIK